MSLGFAIAIVAVLVVLLVVLALAALPRQRPTGTSEREAAIAAQIEVEEHDIEEMLEAQARLRDRLGERSIGDELAEEARRPRAAD